MDLWYFLYVVKLTLYLIIINGFKIFIIRFFFDNINIILNSLIDIIRRK
jgi:hypothetical protein